jgi:hypothetical protein
MLVRGLAWVDIVLQIFKQIPIKNTRIQRSECLAIYLSVLELSLDWLEGSTSGWARRVSTISRSFRASCGMPVHQQ